MPSEEKIMFKEIIEKTRIEFKIDTKEWEYMCFEGSYIPEFIEFALQTLSKEKDKEIEQIFEGFDSVISNLEVYENVTKTSCGMELYRSIKKKHLGD